MKLVKIFDFILIVFAVASLLVASYLFATDTADEKLNQPASQNADTNGKITPTNTSSLKWKYIVIHNSGTKTGNAQIFGRYHREEKNMADGLAYHFVIGNGTKSPNGEVETGSRWHKKISGPHCFDPKMNEESIGICLVGDFNQDKPTKAQTIALVELIKKLQKNYKIPASNVLLHSEVDKGKTDCPGTKFAWKEIKSNIK
jgi:N-acetyl-anhydromuramyl-L-alanine amidase AmpD